VAAVFHLITHAFFKALLFLGSGSVIHGVEHGMHHAEHHDEHGHVTDGHSAAPVRARTKGGADPHDPQDMRNMGNLRHRMPFTFWTFLIGTLALTGIPVFAGFWSKDEILAEAYYKGVTSGELVGLLVWLAGTVGAFLTAFYMARLLFLTFFGEPSSEGARHAPESAKRMVYPLVGLAVFAAILGFVGVHEEFPVIGEVLGNPFHAFTGHLSDGGHFETHAFNAVPAAISVIIAILGWVCGWFLYGRNPAGARARDPLTRLGGLWTLLNRKYYIDELYNGTIIRFTRAFSDGNSWIDRTLVDGVVNAVGIGSELFSRANRWVDTYVVDGCVNAVGWVNMELSRGLKPIQSGRVQQYALILFFSLLFLLGAALF
jgi:NADH-quinone oxidoreductase subunit L